MTERNPAPQAWTFERRIERAVSLARVVMPGVS